jgi:AcrR family transcriptional regulator
LVNPEDKFGPGVYQISVPNVQTGLGPSLRELVHIYRKMRRYVDPKDTDFKDEARQIDVVYHIIGSGPSRGGYANSRRYASGRKDIPTRFQPIDNWLDIAEEQYIKLADDIEEWPDHRLREWLDRAMARCFCYVGWASYLHHRSFHHTMHYDSENIIFGLSSAVVRHLFGDKFKIYPQVMFYAMKAEHAAITEILGHALASGYLDLGGFNQHWAGGAARTVSINKKGLEKVRGQDQNMIDKFGNVSANLKSALAKLDDVDYLLDSRIASREEQRMETKTETLLQGAETLGAEMKTTRNALLLREIEEAITACDIAKEDSPE